MNFFETCSKELSNIENPLNGPRNIDQVMPYLTSLSVRIPLVFLFSLKPATKLEASFSKMRRDEQGDNNTICNSQLSTY
jgi:hypothetical protein